VNSILSRALADKDNLLEQNNLSDISVMNGARTLLAEFRDRCPMVKGKPTLLNGPAALTTQKIQFGIDFLQFEL
jgi:hypothetical protein